MSFVVNTTLNVTVAVTQEKTSVYPNPFNQYLSIEFSGEVRDARYSLVDVSGQVIMYGTLNKVNRLDVGTLSNGVYLIRIRNKGQEQVMQLVK
jgi:hypothetical protein